MHPRFAGMTLVCHSREAGLQPFLMHSGEPNDHGIFAQNDSGSDQHDLEGVM